MNIVPFVSEPVAVIDGLVQEAEPRSEWCYPQDWIVNRLSLDTRGRTYWISGVLKSGEEFMWGLWTDRPLSWRYDLLNATYSIGFHKGDDEMLKSNQSALQVFRDGQWEFVFCHNRGSIITTKDRRKALSAKRVLEWFQSNFGNDQFRSEGETR